MVEFEYYRQISVFSAVNSKLHSNYWYLDVKWKCILIHSEIRCISWQFLQLKICNWITIQGKYKQQANIFKNDNWCFEKLHKHLCKKTYTQICVKITHKNSQTIKTKQTHMFEKWFLLKLLVLCDLSWSFWQKKMCKCIRFMFVSTILKMILRWLWFWWICYTQRYFQGWFCFQMSNLNLC